MEKQFDAYCDKCTRRVLPNLAPGEDFTVATCPQCEADLTYSWYVSQQATVPLRIIGWSTLAILAGLAIHGCSRLAS